MATATETPQPAEKGNTTIATLTEKLTKISREVESGPFSSECLQRDQDILLTQREAEAYRDGILAALSAYSKRIGSLTSEETDTDVQEQVTNSIDTTRFKVYQEFARSDLALEAKLLRLFMHGVEVVQAHWNTAGKDVLLNSIRDGLRQRSADSPSTPHPSPLPVGEGKDAEHTPEKTPEAPSFARYLKDILADPTAPEAINLLNKLKSDSGRLWIDKKKPDGTVVRIWLSLDLGLGNRALTDEELHTRILEKLGDMHNTLRFRVDDLSEGHSWKETKWTEQKKQRIAADVRKIKEALDAEPKGDADAAIQNIATALGLDEKAKEAFTFALFRSYCKKDGPKSDIWTAVRNAYWNADAWQTDIAAVNRELAERFGITTPLQSPSYNTAKIRVWEKIEKSEEKVAIQNAMNTKNPVTLHHAGKPSAKWTLESLKGGFYHLTSAAGKLWIREEHLRISYEYDGATPPQKTGKFELMAWQAQSEEPKGASAPPIAPPPKPKSGPTPPESKPGPAAPVKVPPKPKPPLPKPAAPVTAPPEPRESTATPIKKSEPDATPATSSEPKIPNSSSPPPESASHKGLEEKKPGRVATNAPPESSIITDITKIIDITEKMLKSPGSMKKLQGEFIRFLSRMPDGTWEYAIGKISSASEDGKTITFEVLGTSSGPTDTGKATIDLASIRPWEEIEGKEVDPFKAREKLFSVDAPQDLTVDRLVPDWLQKHTNAKVCFYIPSFEFGRRERRIGILGKIDKEGRITVWESGRSIKDWKNMVLQSYTVQSLEKVNPAHDGELLAEKWDAGLDFLMEKLEKRKTKVIGKSTHLTPEETNLLKAFMKELRTYIEGQEDMKRIRKVLEKNDFKVGVYEAMMDDYVKKDVTIAEPVYDVKAKVVRAPQRAFQLWSIHQKLRGIERVLSGSQLVVKYFMQDTEDIIKLLAGIDPPEREKSEFEKK